MIDIDLNATFLGWLTYVVCHRRPLGRYVACSWALLSALCCFHRTAEGQTSHPSILAATPPMGWNSWNHFGAKVTDADVRSAADAMVANGMRDAGYLYVNVDEGWEGVRDASGVFHSNDRFPDMKALANYVHSRGLRIGLYSSPGAKACGEFEGSLGHEEQDAATFATWGIDFLKYDICSYRKILAEQARGDPDRARELMFNVYKKMDAAIIATGRPMVFSVSQHGLSEIWKWGPEIGANLWRTGDDVQNDYQSVADIGFAQAGLSVYAGPGHWNDPDMLEIGNGSLSPDEARTQMSLWCILASPLLAGDDLSKIDAESLATLTNSEAIRIDQDPAGKQGDRIWSQGPEEVWSRDLVDGSKAVALFNRNAAAAYITLNLRSLGWGSVREVRDVWNHADLKPIVGQQSFLVPRHGVVLLILHQR